VVKDAGSAKRLVAHDTDRVARRLVEAEMAGRARAEEVVKEAMLRAEAVLAHARSQSAEAAAYAAREAQQNEQAKLAALYLALKKKESDRAEKDLDRTIALAVALAERLLGASLALDPAKIVDLARQVLAEARGARRVLIEANPLDEEALQAHVSSLGLTSEVEIRPEPELARGELRVHTDLGTLDARLTPRLERLAAALRDALR
jgi:flagellar biosynthesis/type III secretory pathway protein FliH